MLLWLEVWCNREWFNYAYATYHGRFGKTIDDLPTMLLGLVWLDCLESRNISYVSLSHSEIITFCENVKERSENIIFWKGDSGCKRQELLIRYLLGSDIV